ncbi:hypothetical protein ACWKW1_05960 [Brevibacillus parabrevis]
MRHPLFSLEIIACEKHIAHRGFLAFAECGREDGSNEGESFPSALGV